MLGHQAARVDRRIGQIRVVGVVRQRVNLAHAGLRQRPSRRRREGAVTVWNSTAKRSALAGHVTVPGQEVHLVRFVFVLADPERRVSPWRRVTG